MKPLFRYAGGKTKLLKRIRPLIPDHTIYIEPFVGGGAVYFDLEPNRAIINDTNPYVSNFYRKVFGRDYDFLEQLEGMVALWNDSQLFNTQEKFYYAQRDIFNHFIEYFPDRYDDVRLVTWWLIRQLSFGGMTRYNQKGQYNVPYGKYNNKNLRKAYKHIKKVMDSDLNPQIYGQDFYMINNNILMNEGEEAFFFVDPPYLSSFNNYGQGAFNLKDYMRLTKWMEMVDEMGGKYLAVISYNPELDPVFRKMGKISSITDIEGNFSFNIRNRFETKTKYMFVRNYMV